MSKNGCETAQTRNFIEDFKQSMKCFTYEEQHLICQNLGPWCASIVENNPHNERAVQAKDKLRKVVNQRQSSGLAPIVDQIFIISHEYERLNFYIKTYVKINYSNLFYIVRSYDGSCEGGGTFDIHISDFCHEPIPLFNNPDFENSLSDVNDSGLNVLFERLRGHSLCSSVSYEDFKHFVAELFLHDFDYE